MQKKIKKIKMHMICLKGEHSNISIFNIYIPNVKQHQVHCSLCTLFTLMHSGYDICKMKLYSIILILIMSMVWVIVVRLPYTTHSCDVAQFKSSFTLVGNVRDLLRSGMLWSGYSIVR